MEWKRKPILIGNLKAYLVSRVEAGAYFSLLAKELDAVQAALECALAVPSLHLRVAKEMIGAFAWVGAQDVSIYEPGAHTGEIPAEMLTDQGAAFVLVGHSERRSDGEADEAIAKKLRRALDARLAIVLCVGEMKEEREPSIASESIRRQLRSSLAFVHPEEIKKIVVAYEPAWAVGTDEMPDTKEIAEAVSGIREGLREIFRERAANVPVLYGGSVNAENIHALCIESGADGALVGRASLDAKVFSALARALLE